MASYTIVRGDTLDRIAQRYGTTYQELARKNGIPDPNRIEAGAVIQVPPYDAAPAPSADDDSADSGGWSTGKKVAAGVIGTALAIALFA